MRHLGRTLGSALLALLLVLLVASPAVASHADTDESVVVITGGAHLAEGETAENVIVFDGGAVIDGDVRENVVVFNGPTIIRGNIEEDLVVFSGDVTLDDGASVGGDVTTLEDPTVAGGATIGGEQRGIESLDFDWRFGFAARTGLWVAVSISMLILGLLMLWLAPRAMETMAIASTERTAASALWGLFLFLMLPVFAVLALVTVVGIPFGLGLLLALAPIYSVGYASTCWIVGRRIMEAPRSRWSAFLVGWLVMRLLALIPVVGGIVWTLATIFGLGSMLLGARRGKRMLDEPRTPPPAPAPVREPLPTG